MGIPESNRAFSTRLSDYLILSGRGMVTAESNIHVEMSVLDEIKEYIDNVQEGEINYAEIFSMFEGKLRMLNGIPFIFDFIATIFCALTQKNVYWAAYLRKYFDANVIGIKPSQFSNSEEQNILEKAETVFSAHSHDGLIQIRNTGHDVPPGVKDWYEFSTPLNAVEAQFECQKQNIWWNKKMSQRKIPIIIFVVLFIF